MGGVDRMEWISLVMDHSTITIIFLVLCLLFFNFGSVVCLGIIITVLYFLGSWVLGCL
ncbi:MAG: hypothetical protein K0R78_34 [Pelosinus sp.]|nr:hypothetical protein [Pelosinus sp.]